MMYSDVPPSHSPIILLQGGTGVGTSTFSLMLAKELDIPVVISTDCIRETLRCAISPDINPALYRSSYLAGRVEGFEEMAEEQKEREIIRAFEQQCSPIQAAVDAIVKRAIKENRSVLIEGIHLHPGRVQEADWYHKAGGCITEICLYIAKPETHWKRFRYRQKKAPHRRMDVYFKYFREIRWIHNDLIKRARRCENVACINNNQGVKECMAQLMDVLRPRCRGGATYGRSPAQREATAGYP